MNDLDAADPNIQTAILEVMSEGLSAGVLVYDRNDLIVFASQQFAGFLPPRAHSLAPGTRMRDLLAAMYDAGIRLIADSFAYRKTLSREDWIAEQIAGLWKERSETVERPQPDRFLRVVKRRLPSGYGVCVVKDISEQRRREDQWRLDNERVQVTEEVLDNLPFPISVKDRNSVFVAVNKANCDFLDLPAEAILGHSGGDVNPSSLEDRLGPINQHVYETGEPVQIPERIIRPDGSSVVVIVHKYRIGKPGRYYLVTVKEDVSAVAAGFGDEVPGGLAVWGHGLIETDLTREQQASPVENDLPVDMAGAKVLVVTRFADAQHEALDILGNAGVDASAATGADELALFLQLASEADVGIDLVAIDARMPAECADVAAAHGMPALWVEPQNFGRELTALVGAELRAMRDEKPFVPPIVEEVRIDPVDNGIDILVCEDNEVNQIVFSQIIEGFGYRYALAVDGEEAVRLWREHAPRMVLMDITLPKLTGFEASSAIRALEEGPARVPIIGVLPQAFDRDREACFNAGMDDVILKPISPEALDAVFRTFLYPPEADVETSYSSVP